jgi:APA family basic amino acid/polyamine antiporter
MRNPARDLSRGVLIGVLGVITLYVAVNLVCLRVLGAAGLAATSTPATAIMRAALGSRGATFIAAGIAISTLGFLSQSMLTAPRVYFAMAEDGVFFKGVAWVNPKTAAPVVAIVMQGIWAIVVAASGKYESILNYVVSVDFIWFGLTGLSLFVFRRRNPEAAGYRAPGHPFTTLFFTASCWVVVANTVYKYPSNTLIGLAILASGVPVYFWWQRANA